jgi:iron complex transport system ATP-binding protein
MALTAQNLRFAYTAARDVLADVSLALVPGRIGVLLGPNGSGKSTLLKLMLGLLTPTSGQVEYEGRTLASHRPRDLARAIAYLPQTPAHEEGQTVGEVLRAGRTPYLQAFGLESPRDVEVVRETAARLHLTDLMARPMDQLSGGQRQRAFLARALVQEPKVLLLDEPSTFLDLRHQHDLWQLLRQLAREKQLGILAASHDLNLSAAFADELLLLHEGRLAARGTPAAVLEPGLLSKVYELSLDRLDRPGKTPVVFPSV